MTDVYALADDEEREAHILKSCDMQPQHYDSACALVNCFIGRRGMLSELDARTAYHALALAYHWLEPTLVDMESHYVIVLRRPEHPSWLVKSYADLAQWLHIPRDPLYRGSTS